MRTAIRKHYLDFLAIIGLLLVAAVGVDGDPRQAAAGAARRGCRSWARTSSRSRPRCRPPRRSRRARARRSTSRASRWARSRRSSCATARRSSACGSSRSTTGSTGTRRSCCGPKTGLKDMVAELTPGHRDAGRLHEGGVIPVSQTLPDVNLDEILAALDSDTRDYLLLLLNDGAQGLGGERKGRELAQAIRRLEPTAKYAREINEGLAERRAQPRPRRAQLLAADQRARAARHAARGLRAELQRGVRHAGRPGRGAAADPAEAAGHAGDDADHAREGRRRWPTSSGRRWTRCSRPPGRWRRRCAPTRPFLRETTPIIRDEIRPFTRAALPTVQELRPAMRDLAATTPDLTALVQGRQPAAERGRLQPARRQPGGLPVLAVVGQPRGQRDLLDAGRARADPARPRRAVVLDRAAAGLGRPGQPAARHARRRCSTRRARAQICPHGAGRGEHG